MPQSEPAVHAPINQLTGLRFVAAMCVVFSHSLPALAPAREPSVVYLMLSTLSGLGMSIFFVLSGFVIHYNYADKIGRTESVYAFFVARFARLYPLYAILVSAEIAWMLWRSPQITLEALPYYATLTQSWFYIPLSGHALVYQFGSIAAVSWSISTEWFFYIAFPLLCLLLPRSAGKNAVLFAILCVAGYLVFGGLQLHKPELFVWGLRRYGPIGADPRDSFFRWMSYFSPYARILEFMLGMLVAAFATRLREPSEAEARQGALLTAILFAAIVIIHYFMFGFQSSSAWTVLLTGLHTNIGYAPFVAGFMFCFVRYRSAISTLLGSSILVWGGELSYSMYLLHPVIISRFRAGGQFDWLGSLPFADDIRIIVALLAVFLASFVTWGAIEMPLRRWIRSTLSLQPST